MRSEITVATPTYQTKGLDIGYRLKLPGGFGNGHHFSLGTVVGLQQNGGTVDVTILLDKDTALTEHAEAIPTQAETNRVSKVRQARRLKVASAVAIGSVVLNLALLVVRT